MSNPNNIIDARKFNKSNYSDAIKINIPNLYFEDEYVKENKDIDALDQVINSNLAILGNFTSIVNISSINGTLYSSINTPSGLSPFFVKQNKLTDIQIDEFEKFILNPINLSFKDFKLKEDFSKLLKTTLLPGIILNKPTLDFLGNASPSANHNYLITKLNWLYFLNFNAPATMLVQPSSIVHDLLVNKLYAGDTIGLNDCINGLTRYIWKNYSTCSTWRTEKLIPNDFRPPPYVTSDFHTSGEQQLDKLSTLVNIVYSPLDIDSADIKIKLAINDYIENNHILWEKKYQGPFINLVKAFSFAFADYSDTINRLQVLNDLGKCPAKYLPLLAKLIGWKLFGNDPDKWRLQLANAVDIYKITGTRNSLQFVINSTLGDEVIDLESSISELWESYIPYMIYYSLATESKHLVDFTTWDRVKAAKLGVSVFDESNFDTNIRLCVDKIIFNLVTNFKNNFFLGNKNFAIGSPNFIFNYRGRDYKVPPFEEIPYYLNIITSEDLILAIQDNLICFGVSNEFAKEVSKFIRENIITSVGNSNSNSSWLFFTDTNKFPPNWESVAGDFRENDTSDYLSLWNAKSSHFRVLLDTSNFSFSKYSLNSDSTLILNTAAESLINFSPAKSIPIILARSSSEDSVIPSTDITNENFINFGEINYPAINSSKNSFLAGYQSSALAMATYKRGLTSNNVKTFSRENVDSLIDPLISSSGATALLPRRNHRRRDFKFILPREGFYDRTGFNMPCNFGNSSKEFVVLGLIPSSQCFVPIPDYNNIPKIYDICENSNSKNIFSGLVVSNTFDIRGINTKFSSTLDHGQLHPVVATMHYIMEQTKLLQASAYYFVNPTEIVAESTKWKNINQSYANSATEFNGAPPNSFNDYTKFKFGRDFHKLYYEYTHNFLRHRIIPSIFNLDGPTIFGHTFGSILYNSKLTDFGIPGLISRDLNNIIELHVGGNVFSYPFGGGFQTFIAGAGDSTQIGGIDLRNSAILKNIDLSQVSGSGKENYFSIVKLDETKIGSKNPLFNNKTVLIQNSFNGFGRIIFDLAKYTYNSAELFDVSKNFLTPEHKFKLSFKSMLYNFDGMSTGGGSVGIWIHTKKENNTVWTYTKDKTWIKHSTSGIGVGDFIENYCNVFNMPKEDITFGDTNCASVPGNNLTVGYILGNINESKVKTVDLYFDTINLKSNIYDNYYTDVSHNTHRVNQEYVIEIFAVPEENNSFTIFYDIDMIDLTLSILSKPFAAEIPPKPPYLISKLDFEESIYRVNLSRERFATILKYFNEINNNYTNFGYANRVSFDTSNVYEASGGSRINYTESPYWNNYSVTSTSKAITGITFIN